MQTPKPMYIVKVVVACTLLGVLLGAGFAMLAGAIAPELVPLPWQATDGENNPAGAFLLFCMSGGVVGGGVLGGFVILVQILGRLRSDCDDDGSAPEA